MWTTTLLITVSGVCAVLCVATAQVTAQEEKQTQSSVIGKLMTNYDKTVHPGEAGNEPVNVSIGIYMIKLQIDQNTQSAKVVMYFRQSWVDPRLAYDPQTIGGEQLLFQQTEQVWRPDTFIVKQLSPAVVDNELFRVSPTGRVWYVQRMYATVGFEYIGGRHKSHEFQLLIESFAHTTVDVQLSPMINPIDMDDLLNSMGSNQKYQVVETFQENCTQSYSSGTYPCLRLRFLLSRVTTNSEYSWLSNIPSVLAVVLSWSSFWFKPSSTDGAVCRTVIGLLTILMAVITGNWRHATNLDVFVTSEIASQVLSLGCLIIVVATFIESVVVIVLPSSESNGTKETSAAETGESDTSGDKRRRIDFIAKILSPVAFVLVVFSAVFVITAFA